MDHFGTLKRGHLPPAYHVVLLQYCSTAAVALLGLFWTPIWTPFWTISGSVLVPNRYPGFGPFKAGLPCFCYLEVLQKWVHFGPLLETLFWGHFGPQNTPKRGIFGPVSPYELPVIPYYTHARKYIGWCISQGPRDPQNDPFWTPFGRVLGGPGAVERATRGYTDHARPGWACTHPRGVLFGTLGPWILGSGRSRGPCFIGIHWRSELLEVPGTPFHRDPL